MSSSFFIVLLVKLCHLFICFRNLFLQCFILLINLTFKLINKILSFTKIWNLKFPLLYPFFLIDWPVRVNLKQTKHQNIMTDAYDIKIYWVCPSIRFLDPPPKAPTPSAPPSINLYMTINFKLFCIILGLGQVKTISRPSAARTG